MSKPPMPDPLHVEDFIRLQVRVQQLERALRDAREIITSPQEPYDLPLCRIVKLIDASLPTPPSPPTEAHNMRELGITEDD